VFEILSCYLILLFYLKNMIAIKQQTLLMQERDNIF